MAIRFLRAAAACAAGLLTVVGAAVPAAGASVVPGWRITTVLRHCGDDNLSSVTALGPGDAWALGQPPWSEAPGCGEDVEHWNGKAWRRVAVPGNVFVGGSAAVPPAASSASDAWIFPVKAANVGVSYYAYNYALHWNGRAWRASEFPAKLILESAVDLGPGDVWAFGVTMPRADTFVPYAARYNGRAWRHVRFPIAPMAVAAAGGGLWALGPTTATAGEDASGQRIVAMFFNGRSWRSLAVPKVKVPAGQASFDAISVTTAGPRDLWWSYDAYNEATRAGDSGLLHWNGTAWRAVTLPPAIAGGSVTAITPDGHGGAWLAAFTGLDMTQYWFHYHGGRWSKSLVPSPRGYGNMVLGMAWIPGTASLWAVGEADADTGTHTVGVIAKYGA